MRDNVGETAVAEQAVEQVGSRVRLTQVHESDKAFARSIAEVVCGTIGRVEIVVDLGVVSFVVRGGDPTLTTNAILAMIQEKRATAKREMENNAPIIDALRARVSSGLV